MTAPLSEIRFAVLVRMIGHAPGQKLGRTQLMKLFYFLQELEGVPLGYDFRLFNYGPYDSEVLSDLATACSQNMVKETTVIYSRGYGYEITAGTNAARLGDDLQTSDPAIAAKVDTVIREFGSFGAGELELRSTIYFVDREFHQAGPAASGPGLLCERVRQIKPHFSEATILARIKEMTEKGWLKSFNP